MINISSGLPGKRSPYIKHTWLHFQSSTLEVLRVSTKGRIQTEFLSSMTQSDLIIYVYILLILNFFALRSLHAMLI